MRFTPFFSVDGEDDEEEEDDDDDDEDEDLCIAIRVGMFKLTSSNKERCFMVYSGNKNVRTIPEQYHTFFSGAMTEEFNKK